MFEESLAWVLIGGPGRASLLVALLTLLPIMVIAPSCFLELSASIGLCYSRILFSKFFTSVTATIKLLLILLPPHQPSSYLSDEWRVLQAFLRLMDSWFPYLIQ